MEGPHCPKCGAHNLWAHYSGPEENPDALRCTNGASGLYVGCSYIYWRRNAPAGESTSKEYAATVRAEHDAWRAAEKAKYAIEDRRARVRALVHSILLSRATVTGFPSFEWALVEVAVAIDDAIEKIGAAPGVPPA